MYELPRKNCLFVLYIYLFNLHMIEINQEKQINVGKHIDNKRYVVTILLLLLSGK